MKKNKLIINFKSATNGLLSLVANLFSAPARVVFVPLPGRFVIRR